MLIEEAIVQLIAGSNSTKPLGRRTSSQEHQLITVGAMSAVGNGLLVLVDVVERRQLWFNPTGHRILVNKRSAFLFG